MPVQGELWNRGSAWESITPSAMQAPHPEPFQLFQMFSPPPSCWVAQEASAPFSAGFSFQVSAKAITSMGSAFPLAGCFCSEQKP